MAKRYSPLSATGLRMVPSSASMPCSELVAMPHWVLLEDELARPAFAAKAATARPRAMAPMRRGEMVMASS
jgi:hypothetical protein